MNYFKKFAAMLAALMLAVMFFACSDGDSKNNDDGKNDQDGNSVVCTYVQEGDQSNYLIFYADGTVEYYISDKLEYSRSTLYYKGNPTASYKVSLTVNTGVELFSFTVVKNGDGSVGAKENNFGLYYTVKTESQGNNSGENGKNEKDDGKNDKDENSAVCTYVLEGDQSNYFKFYSDGTVEYYIGDKLEYQRNTLSYTGTPNATGTVKINVITGAELFSFSVTKSDDGSITANENIFGLVYTTKADSSGDSGNGENNNGSGISDENDDTQKDSLMFGGFNNVVNIENGTDITEITMTIYSLTSNTTLKFKGGINSITLTTIAAAIGTNDSVNIALDLSETTGITTWTNKLAGQKTLYAISLPSTVTSVEDNAFYECTNLKAITIPKSIKKWPSVDSKVIVNFDGTLTDWLNSSQVLSKNCILYLNGEELSGKVTIPDSVTEIRRNAFANCSKITSIIIPDTITRIGDAAFKNCTKLSSITIPDTVKSIGGYAFEGCGSLITVNYRGTQTQWHDLSFGGNYSNPYDNGAKLYINGVYIIPVGTTHIKNYEFRGSSNLTSIIIPDTVTSIGAQAFYDCSGLTAVYYEGTIEQWVEISFYDTTSNPICYAHHLYIGDSEVTDLVIPDAVTSIGAFAFYGCSGLTSITIPDSVTTIREWAFHDCSGLTSIIIPSSLTSIEGCVFAGCSGLTNIIIPDSVTSIEDGAFCGCSGLTSITIPANVTSIGASAFKGCSGLTSITIPNTVTRIKEYAFHECSATINYRGTEEQWATISIGPDNEPLTTATIVYNYTGD